MLERRKFRELGINIPYDFNDTDYSVSDDVLKAYLDAYEETSLGRAQVPHQRGELLRGRVTDEIDRRVLSGYLNQFFCGNALRVPHYPLSPGRVLRIPKEGLLDCTASTSPPCPSPLKAYLEAFGQHPNADISYMITDLLHHARVVPIAAAQAKRGDSAARG